MAEGPSLLVSGELFADGWWHVSIWLHQHPNGLWRIGRPTDSETYVLNHVMASKPARCGAHKVATKAQRRELLRQVYEFVDPSFALAATAPSSSQGAARSPIYPKETKHMQCAIITDRGKGKPCPHTALEGLDVCKLHRFLEGKLGQLPRVGAAPVEIMPVVEPAMAARASLDTISDADFSGQPIAAVEVPAEAAPVLEAVPAVEEAPKKTRKVRKDKGVARKRS
jgi:hypothetical protein